ncbi:MAG: molecular chaperone GrpE [Candidatus Tokpelaia sp. JSC189]|nr:MAG: molecular chaperone GrpE [Candidatus Tokpelaia sp. JSC189]
MPDEKNVDGNPFDQPGLNNLKDCEVLERAEGEFLKNHTDQEEARYENANDVQELPNSDSLAIEAENAELKDRVMRLSADMENLRRRTARDVINAKTYSITNFARDMLSVSDNLSRALHAIPVGACESDPKLKALAEGVEMTERAMMAALQCHDVKKIEPLGQKFDPHFHQAMFEVADPSVPPNTITQVVQAGYVIGERVLRPAMVGVAKSDPKNIMQPDETAEE